MEYFTKHFVVISALATLLATAFSTAILASYLSVFNASLLYVVEYQDVFAFSLILVGFGAGVATFANYIYVWTARAEEHNFFKYAIAVVVAIIVVGSMLTSALDRVDYEKYNIGGKAESTLLIMAFIGAAVSGAKALPDLNPWWAFTNLLLLPMGACAVWGATFANEVKRDNSTRFDVETGAISKFPDRMHDLQLVLFLSHHAIFRSGENLIVLPTGDITKMTVTERK